MTEPPRKDTTESVLREYDIYDQHVDVVSIFEWLFTDPGVADLPGTVTHFERFPHIPMTDGTTLTPDFTVLFNDGTAIVGEIARIALHPRSVDSLCSQIGKYAAITNIPSGPNRQTATATHVDVVYLVDFSQGNTAHREIMQRYNDPQHPYKPSAPPCIVAYSRQSGTDYSFARHQGPANGTLSSGQRAVHIGDYLEGNLNAKADNWIHVKVARPFMNDPIKKLYLANHLTMRTWNDMFGPGTDDLKVTPPDVAEHLRQHYDVGRIKDVKAALELLDRAGLAAPEANGQLWTVSRQRLIRRGESDVHKIIAARIDGKSRRAVARVRTTPPEPPQGTLW